MGVMSGAPLREIEEAQSPDEVLERFAQWIAARGITLYPAQEEAILTLLTGAHVILATPTGSGKSLVAVAAHAAALAAGEGALGAGWPATRRGRGACANGRARAGSTRSSCRAT